MNEEKWWKSQDNLELYQLKKSSVLRHISKRASDFDQLVADIALRDVAQISEAKDVSPVEPLAAVKNIKHGDIEASIVTAKRLMSLESNPVEVDYWKSIIFLLESRLQPLTLQVADLVEKNIDSVLDTKSYTELELLGQQAAEQLENNPVNSRYWLEVQSLVQSKAAVLKLSEIWESIRTLGNGETQISGDAKPKHTAFVEAIIAVMQEDEGEFDSLESFTGEGIEPEYFCRMIVGPEPNYFDKSLPVYNEPYLARAVAGYKFALFYPDLVGSLDTPGYKVHKRGDGTSNITFSATGYKDTTFRIIDDVWEHGKFQDTKPVSKFEKGVLYLEFKFKRNYK